MAISLNFKGFNASLKGPMSMVLAVSLTVVASSLPNSALAQEGSAGALLEEIVTVARKRSEAEAVQDVPVAVTAFGAEQIEALFVKKLDDLSYMMPNVQLEAVGTFPGVQNFSIRGQARSATPGARRPVCTTSSRTSTIERHATSGCRRRSGRRLWATNRAVGISTNCDSNWRRSGAAAKPAE